MIQVIPVIRKLFSFRRYLLLKTFHVPNFCHRSLVFSLLPSPPRAEIHGGKDFPGEGRWECRDALMEWNCAPWIDPGSAEFSGWDWLEEIWDSGFGDLEPGAVLKEPLG